MARKAQTAEVPTDAELLISVPLGTLPESGYEVAQAHSGKVKLDRRGVHVNINFGEECAVVLLRMRNGLRDGNHKLASGRPVYTNTDTLRWLLEQAAANVG